MTEIRYTLPGAPTTWKRTNKVGPRGRQITGEVMRRSKRAHYLAALASMPPALRAMWDTEATYELEVIVFLPSARSEGDADNYAKLVADALQGVAYRNDRQVTDIIGRRRIDRSNPRTEVVVRVRGSADLPTLGHERGRR